MDVPKVSDDNHDLALASTCGSTHSEHLRVLTQISIFDYFQGQNTDSESYMAGIVSCL